MDTKILALNRASVFCSAVVYWSGVWVQARRVRKRIGRSPNVRPQGPKERLLWAGWALVVMAWLALPFLTGLIPSPVHPLGTALGIILLAIGYAGTLWCYVAMGNAWR